MRDGEIIALSGVRCPAPPGHLTLKTTFTPPTLFSLPPSLGKKRHAILIPEPVERALGETTFARMMAGKRRLPDSDPRSQRVARLGARLARIAMAGDGGKGYTGHLADCAWRFVVVVDPEINACALPGGKVVGEFSMFSGEREDTGSLSLSLFFF